ncbi:gamma-glutamyltransferase [Paraliobacillus sediminis]|uniref:gamma-glutamyltransferase n=1 Tax=Paraliobacillus sediminis TaxID=1885916 RepID=UPI000E3BAF90|nr:gamma-glutamyltransferase [Paraliobacillus sediminis]
MKSYRPTTMGMNGMVTTPHYLASQAAISILQKGGNAVEAAITAASVLSVVYPHMNGLGGDNFWLIHNATTGETKGLNASGKSSENATIEWYIEKGYNRIPLRGYGAANTVPGALSGWDEAYTYAKNEMDSELEWSELLQGSIDYAEKGFPVTPSQEKWTRTNNDSTQKENRYLQRFDGFKKTYLKENNDIYQVGEVFKQSDLAKTLNVIAEEGVAAFYQGKIADKIVADMKKNRGLLSKDDFANHRAVWVNPIATDYRAFKAINLPPNTQGLASLMILNTLNQIDFSKVKEGEDQYIHYIVEATKKAFEARDKYVTDPAYLEAPITHLLSKEYGEARAKEIVEGEKAKELARLDPKGDTVWFGVVDSAGNAVSIIQSIYHDFGSGIIPEGTGVLLQNRGSFFVLDENHIHGLAPNKRPFHTLNPAMLLKNNKPHLVYGTMGGEGQPQTQAALVTRIVDYQFDLQQAIEAPRWLYGRTWGEESNSLKVENRLSEKTLASLRKKGHDIEIVPPFSDVMGHAGAILINQKNQVLFGAADPRGDGAAIGY